MTPHFTLAEFIGALDPNDVPTGIIENIEWLVLNVLEPARVGLGLPIRITSGYRSPAHNAAVGGSPTSDHVHGKAADCQAAAGDGMTWEQNTIRLAAWIREHRQGKFGQLILEDHREYRRKAGRANWRQGLWVHVSSPTVKHPGDRHDPSRELLCTAPGVVEPLTSDHLA